MRVLPGPRVTIAANNNPAALAELCCGGRTIPGSSARPRKGARTPPASGAPPRVARSRGRPHARGSPAPVSSRGRPGLTWKRGRSLACSGLRGDGVSPAASWARSSGGGGSGPPGARRRDASPVPLSRGGSPDPAAGCSQLVRSAAWAPASSPSCSGRGRRGAFLADASPSSGPRGLAGGGLRSPSGAAGLCSPAVPSAPSGKVVRRREATGEYTATVRWKRMGRGAPLGGLRCSEPRRAGGGDAEPQPAAAAPSRPGPAGAAGVAGPARQRAPPQRALHGGVAARVHLHGHVPAARPAGPRAQTRAHLRQQGHELRPLVAVEVLGGRQLPAAGERRRGRPGGRGRRGGGRGSAAPAPVPPAAPAGRALALGGWRVVVGVRVRVGDARRVHVTVQHLIPQGSHKRSPGRSRRRPALNRPPCGGSQPPFPHCAAPRTLPVTRSSPGVPAWVAWPRPSLRGAFPHPEVRTDTFRGSGKTAAFVMQELICK